MLLKCFSYLIFKYIQIASAANAPGMFLQTLLDHMHQRETFGILKRILIPSPLLASFCLPSTPKATPDAVAKMLRNLSWASLRVEGRSRASARSALQLRCVGNLGDAIAAINLERFWVRRLKFKRRLAELAFVARLEAHNAARRSEMDKELISFCDGCSSGCSFCKKRASEFQRNQESSGKLVDGGPGGISINARLASAWKALIKINNNIIYLKFV